MCVLMQEAIYISVYLIYLINTIHRDTCKNGKVSFIVPSGFLTISSLFSSVSISSSFFPGTSTVKKKKRQSKKQNNTLIILYQVHYQKNLMIKGIFR